MWRKFNSQKSKELVVNFNETRYKLYHIPYILKSVILKATVYIRTIRYYALCYINLFILCETEVNCNAIKSKALV